MKTFKDYRDLNEKIRQSDYIRMPLGVSGSELIYKNIGNDGFAAIYSRRPKDEWKHIKHAYQNADAKYLLDLANYKHVEPVLMSKEDFEEFMVTDLM